MGTGKKEAARKERQGKNGDGMANVRVKVCLARPFLSI
jgi:nuclear GTP-binding protein